ncbi:collagen alpha-1(III) chain-like [Leguminivora glycinivorella]|uniref:collagen alpha-1(III) chain-like n=1 Tax=Leguminivora glycinivorella TaxID=1035111 RepID=UPI002010C4DB|nr:collagen alpha-1(III) chain-like [Leguminivora glycinivorella]
MQQQRMISGTQMMEMAIQAMENAAKAKALRNVSIPATETKNTLRRSRFGINGRRKKIPKTAKAKGMKNTQRRSRFRVNGRHHFPYRRAAQPKNQKNRPKLQRRPPAQAKAGAKKKPSPPKSQRRPATPAKARQNKKMSTPKPQRRPTTRTKAKTKTTKTPPKSQPRRLTRATKKWNPPKVESVLGPRPGMAMARYKHSHEAADEVPPTPEELENGVLGPAAASEEDSGAKPPRPRWSPAVSVIPPWLSKPHDESPGPQGPGPHGTGPQGPGDPNGRGLPIELLKLPPGSQDPPIRYFPPDGSSGKRELTREQLGKRDPPNSESGRPGHPSGREEPPDYGQGPDERSGHSSGPSGSPFGPNAGQGLPDYRQGPDERSGLSSESEESRESRYPRYGPNGVRLPPAYSKRPRLDPRLGRPVGPIPSPFGPAGGQGPPDYGPPGGPRGSPFGPNGGQGAPDYGPGPYGHLGPPGGPRGSPFSPNGDRGPPDYGPGPNGPPHGLHAPSYYSPYYGQGPPGPSGGLRGSEFRPPGRDGPPYGPGHDEPGMPGQSFGAQNGPMRQSNFGGSMDSGLGPEGPEKYGFGGPPGVYVRDEPGKNGPGPPPGLYGPSGAQSGAHFGIRGSQGPENRSPPHYSQHQPPSKLRYIGSAGPPPSETWNWDASRQQAYGADSAKLLLRELKPPDPFHEFPKVDDFGEPIEWVPLIKANITDGLARLTDRKTGRNMQARINGTVFVPVSHQSTTTTEPTTTTTQYTTTPDPIMESLLQYVTPRNLKPEDWLAFDVTLNKKKAAETCAADGCQARCHKDECGTACQGDTCATGVNSFISIKNLHACGIPSLKGSNASCNGVLFVNPNRNSVKMILGFRIKMIKAQ